MMKKNDACTQWKTGYHKTIIHPNDTFQYPSLQRYWEMKFLWLVLQILKFQFQLVHYCSFVSRLGNYFWLTYTA